jgi:hypothetical protein
MKMVEAANQKEYRSMISSLLYLTVTWPDIQFTVCLCAHSSLEFGIPLLLGNIPLPHALHIGQLFSRFSGILNTHASLEFGIPLLLHLILLAFLILILRVVGLTERALLVLVIFLDLHLFAGLLENNLQLLNPP